MKKPLYIAPWYVMAWNFPSFLSWYVHHVVLWALFHPQKFYRSRHPRDRADLLRDPKPGDSCSVLSTTTDPGSQSCEGDGHYLCKECTRLSSNIDP